MPPISGIITQDLRQVGDKRLKLLIKAFLFPQMILLIIFLVLLILTIFFLITVVKGITFIYLLKRIF
jgi:hypothetical protein